MLEGMSDYKGPADLITGSVHHSGTVELDRTDDGWSGWFAFNPGSELSVDQWRDLMLAASREFALSPAAIQVPKKVARPATVEGSGERIRVAGEGTPPWEGEG